MGRAILACVLEDPGLRLLGAWEREGHAGIGTDAGVLAGRDPCGIVVETRPETPPAGARVLVDFTDHEAAVATASWAASHGLALAIGTTGFTREEREILRGLAGRTPVLVAPNLSVGMNVLFALVQETARGLGGGYDVEIVEMHHRHKRDAPSGSALRLAESVRQGRAEPEAPIRHGRRGDVGERPPEEIGMHAVRAGEIVGEHQVIFAGPGERLELTHRAASREAFARGVPRAVRFLAKSAPGWYEMSDVLGLG